MQVFNAFIHIARKRINAAIIYFIIYAVITVLITTFGQSSYEENFKASALSISVADEDDSTASRALTSYLASIHVISQSDGDAKKLLDQIYYRTVGYSLTIPSGFEEALLSGNTEELLSYMAIPGSNRCQYVNQQISQYLTSLELYLAGGYDLDDALAKTAASTAQLPDTSTVTFHTGEGGTNTAVFYFFQYLPYVFLVILFSGMAPILVTLNQKELLDRISCSALPATRRVRELSLGCVVYALIVWLLFLLLAIVMYRTDLLIPNVGLAVLNSLVFLLFAVAITILVSCFAPDENVLNMIANMIGLSMSFLCGVFVPQSILPASVLSAAKFLPAYWYIRANNMLGGFGKEVFDMDFYWLCIGIQLLFAAAMFALAIVFSRQKKHR